MRLVLDGTARRAAPLFFALGIACGTDPAQPPNETPPPIGGTISGLCAKDPALIASRRSCQRDDACPCGAHCTLGVCEASCTVDSDCNTGERCDDFGRCRASGAQSRLPDFTIPSAPSVALRPSRIDLDNALESRPFWLDIAGGGTTEARIQADEGLSVRCEPNGAYVRECTISWTQGRAEPIEVRAESLLALDELRNVRVTAGGSHANLLVGTSAGLGALLGEAKPDTGIYGGYARLIGVAAADRTIDSSATIELPIELTLYGTVAQGTLVIVDPLQAILPTGRWVGEVSDGRVRMPRRLAIENHAIGGLDVELLVTGTGTVSSDQGRRVAVQLELETTGFSGNGAELRQVWSLIGNRKGELASDVVAPAIDTEAQATLDLQRGTAQSGWESLFWSAFDQPANGVYFDLARTQQALTGAPIPAFCARDVRIEGASNGALMEDLFLDGSSDYQPDGTVNLIYGGFDNTTPDLATQYGAPLTNFVSSRLAPGGPMTVLPATGSITNFTIAMPSRAGTLDTAVPCDFDIVTTAVPTEVKSRPQTDIAAVCQAAIGETGNPSIVFDGRSVRSCQALADQFGCVVETLPAPAARSVNFQAKIDYQGPGWGPLPICSIETINASAPMFVNKVCRMPRPEQKCAESALCAQPNSDVFQTVSILDDLEPTGGDPRCNGARSESGFGFWSLTQAGLRPTEVIDTCLQDLALLATDPSSAAPIEAITARPCLEGPRFLATLEAGLEPARLLQLGLQPVVDETSLRIASRSLQAWFILDTFLARESLQSDRLAEVVRRLDNNPSAGSARPSEIAPVALGAWSLLLHPRTGPALLHLPSSVLLDADARTDLGITTGFAAHHEQSVPFLVNAAEAMSAHLELMNRRLALAAEGKDATAMSDLGAVVRTTLWSRAVLSGVQAQIAGAPQPAWWDRYRSALRGADLRFGQLARSSQGATAGRSTLGIDDSDLPLYFLGNESSVSNRFSAVSDFLLGQGPGSLAWAPAAIRAASDSLAAARSSWLAYQDRNVLRAQSEAELEQKLDEIRFDFGDRVAEFCSAPNSLGTADILESWTTGHGRPFSANDCYRVYDRPECLEASKEILVGLRAADYGYQFCLAKKGQDFTGERYLGTPAVTKLVAGIESCTDLVIAPCSTTGNCLKCPSNPSVPEAALDVVGRELDRLAGFQVRTTRVADRQACQAQWPAASTRVPQNVNDQALNPRCYRGALGEQSLTLEAAARDIAIAQAEVDEIVEAYDITMKSCAIRAAANGEIQAARDAHNKTMNNLRITRATLESVAAYAGAIKDCANTVSNDLSFGAASAVACGGAVAEGLATSGVAVINQQMESATDLHEAAIAKLGEDADVAVCANDASAQLVSLKSATLRVQSAFDDLRVAQYQFGEMKIAADTYFADGTAALERTRGRFVSPPGHDYWIDENARIFERRMGFAKRLAYLSVRAVEWEYQQSLDARAAVAEAELPEELEAVLQDLQSVAGTRSIGGRRPSDLRLVISLKKELLQIADRSAPSSGEQSVSDSERFQLMLRDSRFSVFSPEGVFLGQRVPFSLAPVATFGVGDPQGISVLAGRDCAERLWSVNASVQGPSGTFNGESSFVRLDLEKSNAFYSQWCDSEPGRGDYQLASVRPSKNLFRGEASAEISGVLGLSREPSNSTSARLQASLNVPRADLESDAYTERASGELAGRGLYGDYSVFIPAASLSVMQGADRKSPGLDLGAIDDILIRFDYVSVARN